MRPRVVSARRGALRSVTALAGAILVAALAGPAWADGGAGGNGGADGGRGGAGGIGFTGDAGKDGRPSAAFLGGGGGGGGGAGGGHGGRGGGARGGGGEEADGGSGGTAGSLNGQHGDIGIELGGGGGGGGGFNGNGVGAATITNISPLAGGTGGTGGNSLAGHDAFSGGGGGGGAGGYGAIVTGGGTNSNTSTITGGDGGRGGFSDIAYGAQGGVGGDGGVGVQFTASGASFTNSGTITGGNGGAGGTGFDPPRGGAGGAGIVGAGLTVINSGSITGGLGGDGATRANAITFTGGTNTLELRAGSTITGNVVAFSTNDTLVLGGSTNGSFDVSQIGSSAQYRGFGFFQKTDTSTWTLTGTTTAGGAWTIIGGTLTVNGSMANSGVFVLSGATLAGTGTVGTTTIARGGTLAPGNSPGTMTVRGNLAFQSGALYLVQASPTETIAKTVVSGFALLDGTVRVTFARGAYRPGTYTILTANDGLAGTKFADLQTSGLQEVSNIRNPHLVYDASNVYLVLDPATLTLRPGLPRNLQSHANAINTFITSGGTLGSGGTLHPAFQRLLNLSASDLEAALTLHTGEAATGAQQVAFQLTNQFLGIMLDPFVDGRSTFGGIGGGGAIGFAPEHEPLPEDIALAYAKVLKAPPKPPAFEQRWSVWGAGYGGTNRTSGDPVVVGSHDLAARTAGGTAGLDYHLSRDSVVGFALAGGGTDWSLAQGLGGGKSDAFQAGLYGATRWGPAYLAAAFAYTNHWMSTDRLTFASDHLTARFNAQSFGGRMEGGYRFTTIYGGLTPYAAIQAQNFRTPSYSESDLAGGGFALAFNSRSATDTRSELGARFDRLLLLNPSAALTMRARVAWAHDWVSDPTLTAVFQTLPGASFIVNGATPAKDSALTSAGAELRLANGVTLLAKFDGEFASHSSTYAGTGTVRYTW
jgi:uncharacterized protein with beta-barrel porin domain